MHHQSGVKHSGCLEQLATAQAVEKTELDRPVPKAETEVLLSQYDLNRRGPAFVFLQSLQCNWLLCKGAQENE